MQYARLNYLALIKIQGPDAKTFLQGQLTCDVEQASETHSTLAAHLNLKGRIVSLGRLFAHGDAYYYIVPESIKDAALKRLKKYAMFSKLTLDFYSGLYIYGFTEASDSTNSWPQECDSILIKNEQFLIKMPGEPNRILCLSHKDLDLNDHNEMDESWWQSLEIQNHIPFLTPETVAKFLPHDLNLPALGGVNFKKGCFVGQEIVARMEYLGKLKKQVTLYEGNALPDAEVICHTTYKDKVFALLLSKK